eukprot:365042-Chlamydomonas_euryale.AAC.7
MGTECGQTAGKKCGVVLACAGHATLVVKSDVIQGKAFSLDIHHATMGVRGRWTEKVEGNTVME